MENEGAAALPGVADGIAETAARAWEMLAAGGPVVGVLVVMSVIAVAIVGAKLWQFRTVRLGDREPARRAAALYRRGKVAKAVDLVRGSPNPAARALLLAMVGRARADVAPDVVREEVMRAGADMLETLRSHMRPLEVIATLAPLLGLFGTVLGMIEAFQQLEQAGNRVNPAILSGGIWQALLTTAVGLAVAMPVVAAVNWLERAVDRLAHEMDDLATQVFTEDLTAADPAAPKTPIIPKTKDHHAGPVFHPPVAGTAD